MKKIVLGLVAPLLLWAETGKLVQIVDGDTMVFSFKNKKTVCQIAYVDMPEIHNNPRVKTQSKRCKIGEKHIIDAGKKATQYLHSVVHVGQPYEVDILERDQRGWARCIVHIPKGLHVSLHPTINGLMIEQGYGVTYRLTSYEKLPNAIEETMDLVQKTKRGLWKDDSDVMECLKER